MDSLQLLTLYLTRTPIFSGRGAKINLHTTPKLTVAMPISCLLPCADPGIFVRGGGGSTAIWQFLVLSLFYRSQMVNFKEKYHFSRFRRGSKFFQRGGGGGGQLFPRGCGGGGGGSNRLFPIETHITCDFNRGGGGSGPPVPLWIRTWLRSI